MRSEGTSQPFAGPLTVWEQILFSTVLIEVDRPTGVGAGTGFFFSYAEEGWDGAELVALVTNKHVISGGTSGRLFFTHKVDGMPNIGKRINVDLANFENMWHEHPDPTIDIVVAFGTSLVQQLEIAGMSPYFRAVPYGLLPTADELSAFDVVEDVLFVGYPNALYDQVNLIPIIRTGVTATPIYLDYQGTPTFLLDASVFRGSSGSPVFIRATTPRVDRHGNILWGGRPCFLGLVSAVMTRVEHGRITAVPIPTQLMPVAEVTQMLDIGIVVKSSAVLEAVRHAAHTWISKGQLTIERKTTASLSMQDPSQDPLTPKATE